MRIPLIKPYLPEGTKERVCQVLDSGFMVEGPVAAALESAMADYVGGSHCIVMDSCTTGLEVALRCLGVGSGHEVIMPDYTFPATAQAILRAGAIPVIVDVDPETMLINTGELEEAVTDATKAVMPVSSFGNPLDYAVLGELKTKYGFAVIEDAACAFGAEYNGQRVGSLADITVFSLHPRKFITTARGGAVTTDNDEWAAWIRSYKCFGKGAQATRATTSFDQDGANAMLPDVLAAIGLMQMGCVDEMLERRRVMAGRYEAMLADVQGVRFPKTPKGGVHSYQSFCVFVDDRDNVISAMREEGIEVQIGTYALHMHPAFVDNAAVRVVGDMKGSAEAFARCLTLPLYHEMTDEEQDEVVESLKAKLV